MGIPLLPRWKLENHIRQGYPDTTCVKSALTQAEGGDRGQGSVGSDVLLVLRA
jgi:hypothetical protein